MSDSSDDKVVNMQFNNTEFNSGIADSNKSLQSLKDNLNFDGVGDSLESLSSRFSTLGSIGLGALTELGSQALHTGESIASNLIDPLIQGGRNRSLAISQAEFQFQGLHLNVAKTMAAALAAVKGTAFGLDEAATAAANFAASGIRSGPALTKALQSVAGVAALTGSSYSDIANIFTKVAGQGRLMGQDLLSLSARGVNAAAILGKALHKTEPEIRDMVSKGKISFKEFSDAMDSTFGAHAKDADKTFTGALANMHAALARVGQDLWDPILESERRVFNALGPAIDNIHGALLPLIKLVGTLEQSNADKFVKSINGIDLLPLKVAMPLIMESINNTLTFLGKAVKPIADAFKEIFPAVTGANIVNFAAAIRDFTASLKISGTTANDVKRTFAGIFALFDIGFRVISAIARAFLSLFGDSGKAAGGILDFTGNLGDFIVGIDKAVKAGDSFNKFFGKIATFLKPFVEGIEAAVGFVGALISSLFQLNAAPIDKFASNFGDRFKILTEIGQFFKKVWDGVIVIAKTINNLFAPLTNVLVGFFKEFGPALAKDLTSLNFSDAISLIQTGLFGGLVLSINGFFGNFGQILSGNRAAIVGPFKAIITQLRVNLKALEMNLNAKTLLTIGEAIALIAASAFLMSTVNPVKLGAAMAAITVSMGALLGAFAIIQKIKVTGGILAAPAAAAAIVGVAVAIDILTIAVVVLSHINLPDLAKGLGAVVVMLAAVALATKLISKDKGLAAAATGILLISGSLLIMANAVKILANISLANLAKGVGTVAVVLGVLIAALLVVSKNSVKIAASGWSIAILAGSLAVIAKVIQTFGKLKFPVLSEGLLGMAGALAIMVIALNTLPGPEALAGAVSLVIAAAALAIITKAFASMGKIPWDNIGRGFTVMAGSLILLVAALTLLSDPLALVGAAALIIGAEAILIVAAAFKVFSTLSWDDIGRSMTILAAGLLIMAVGGAALTAAIPGFLGLGAALFLIGKGVHSAGIGILDFAKALAIIIGLGAAAGGAVALLMTALAKALPAIGTGLAQAFVNFLNGLVASGAVIEKDLVQLLGLAFAALSTLIPQFTKIGILLAESLIQAFQVLYPRLVNAGITVLEKILEGIARNIEKITASGLAIIAGFINGIADGQKKLDQAGVNLVVKFIDGIASAIGSKKNQAAMRNAMENLASAVLSGLTGGLVSSSSIKKIISAVSKLVSNIPAAIRKFLGIASPSKVTYGLGSFTVDGLENALNDGGKRVGAAAAGVGYSAVSELKKAIAGVSVDPASLMNLNPTIKPVLDLTQVQKDAGSIPGLLNPGMSLSLDGAKVNATAAVTDAKDNSDAAKSADAPGKGDVYVDLTQNNTSPKALSPIDIYRQTNNQLSLTKEVLKSQ